MVFNYAARILITNKKLSANCDYENVLVNVYLTLTAKHIPNQQDRGSWKYRDPFYTGGRFQKQIVQD